MQEHLNTQPHLSSQTSSHESVESYPWWRYDTPERSISNSPMPNLRNSVQSDLEPLTTTNLLTATTILSICLHHCTQNDVDGDEDEFEEVGEVVDDEDVDDAFAHDDKEKPKKKIIKKILTPLPRRWWCGVGIYIAGDVEGYYTPALSVFAVVVKAGVIATDASTLLPDNAPKREAAGYF
ncbi:hypothetical protein DL96DRAFT_1825362 [Flagelloscypha sp. PMI_526]|nr:hypothetical protein DL96DRAFT_1825362 [Flagelloscypha sp. PMI_526]